MDITSNIQLGFTPFKSQNSAAGQPSVPGGASVPQVRETVPAPEVAKVDSTPDVRAEEQRMKAVRRALDSYKALFPISQTRFTIYKGVGGEFFTRVTNMVDGTVRTIPEPELLDYLAKNEGLESISTISTQA